MMRNMIVGLLLAGGALGVVQGCAPSETKWDAEAAQYAVYATQIPLFPGTTVTEAMGSESWGDEPDSYIYGMTWWCETKATRIEILAWYKQRLPGATESTTEDGGTKLTLSPEGAAPNEDMGVLIEEDGKYRVFEHTKKAKEGTL